MLILFPKNIPCIIEGEELTVGRSTALLYAPGIIQRKIVGAFIELGKVVLAVIIEISVFVNLQQAAHIHVGRFAVLLRIVKKIGQRFAAQSIIICICQRRIVIFAKFIVDNTGAGTRIARPMVYIA